MPSPLSSLRLAAGLLLLGAAPLFAADGPTPYPDPKNEAAWPGKGPIRVFGWMNDNRKFFWTQRTKDQGKIVFAGDSLIGGWSAKIMAVNFPGLQIANRGIGGDVSRGLLFRLQEDVLDLHPRALVLCTGSNDLSTQADPALTEQNIAAILDLAQKENPKLPIVICLVPPRDVADSPVKPAVQADLNSRIAKIAAGRAHVEVVDTFKALATAEGKPEEKYFTKDRIHPIAEGYAKWTEVLRPALEKLGVK